MRVKSTEQSGGYGGKAILGVAATVFLAVIARSGFAAEPTHVPATALAAANADLIARADRALRDYVAACSIGDQESLARIVTSDAVVEYELQEPGTFFKVEAAAQLACVSANSRSTGTGAQLSNVWIFPTADSNAVYVHYTVGADVASTAGIQHSGQLAIIEMRGDRIFRIRMFMRRSS